jgi:galactofuranosylgalactofuranosylrhamnosyl-N-acetylglucosaminyl-diphospho-decaprenol beta-1,5/1,6-galactofuranosyltransferase
MNVISRIQFPHTPDASDLYMKFSEGASLNLCEQYAEITLTKNGVLSLNTYFNSFYETFYAKYTELKSLYYLLKLEGDFQVSLYRERYGQENRDLIYKENFENCQLGEQIKISLPDSWQSEKAGRVYLEITCLSERGLFTQGYIATEQNPFREVSLGIISCTFKKEAYIKKTVDTILKDELLQDKQFKIFVVDNGKTLSKDEFPEQKVKLIPNRNVGGSGGFTRGLIQAWQEDLYTHFLFMDDDIELESESIFRVFTLYEYAKEDFAISGSMFDLHKKYILYEAGAIYGKYNQNGNYIYNPFTVVPLQNKLNLEDSTVNNLFLGEENPDYGAFWFFAFSKKVIDEMGLPMPFFIKLDDVEFGLRIKERLGQPIVAFPGIAVWHEPFYAKHSVWNTYYWIRNHLITHSMRNSLKYIDAVNFLTRSLLHKLFIFDYNSAELLLKGFEDYMEGPLLMESSDPETLHASIVGLSKSHKSQSIESNSLLESESPNNLGTKKTKDSAFKKLLGLVTLNGHLLPSFLLSKDDAILWITSDNTDWWPKVFTKKRVLILMEGNNSVSQHEMSRTVGIGILIRWFQVVIKAGTRWSYVSSEWRNAFKHLTSIKFWTKYLKLNEQSS